MFERSCFDGKAEITKGRHIMCGGPGASFDLALPSKPTEKHLQNAFDWLGMRSLLYPRPNHVLLYLDSESKPRNTTRLIRRG